jgi:hypothetical protein
MKDIRILSIKYSFNVDETKLKDNFDNEFIYYEMRIIELKIKKKLNGIDEHHIL